MRRVIFFPLLYFLKSFSGLEYLSELPVIYICRSPRALSVISVRFEETFDSVDRLQQKKKNQYISFSGNSVVSYREEEL